MVVGTKKEMSIPMSMFTGVGAQITLIHASNAKRLHAAAGVAYKLAIRKIELIVSYLKLDDRKFESLQSRISRGPLFYDFLRSLISHPFF